MTDQRVARRRESYTPAELHEITLEFQEILGVLSMGYEKLDELIISLTIGIRGKKSTGTYVEDIAYWELFDQAIDNWNRKVNGVFYLRALMEVSVVATELRWANRRTIYLLNTINKQSKINH